MKCDHDAKRRCTWVGTVGTLEEHVATCKFTLVPCPKECKDIKKKVKLFLRNDLDKHLKEECPNRDFSCMHCGEKGTYASITRTHSKKCLKKRVSCPNGCGSIMERQHIPEHVATECELTVIACKYKRLGCDRELKRKDIAAHEEDDKLHLRMAMDATVKLENKTVELESKTVELEDKTVELEDRTFELELELKYKTDNLEDALIALKEPPLKFKLTNYQKKKDNNECVHSPSYYTSPNGYHMALKVFANGEGDATGTHIAVYGEFLKGEYDAQLKWPFAGKITFSLLNQLEDRSHYHMRVTPTAAHNVHVGDAWGYYQFISHSALGYSAVNNTQYLKDDTLYFRMSVEPADQDEPWLQ